MGNKPLISVIIPTYNREKLLPETINSVLNQTYKNWELIIVDDRSTDNTEDLVQRYMKRNKRIKYFLNTHKKGPGGARNQGLKKAKGKYIAFLDSDDIWKQNHLKENVGFFGNSKVDFIFSAYDEKNISNNKSLSELLHRREKRMGLPYEKLRSNFMIYKRSILKEIVECNFIPTQTVVIRKNKLNIKFDEDLFNGQDWDFWIRFIKNNPNIGYINKINCTLRVHEDNISRSSENNKKKLKIINNLIKGSKKRLKIVPQYKPIIKKELAKDYFDKGYFYRKTNKPKALYYYLNSMRYGYDPRQLKAIKKLFIPGYYKHK